MGLQRMISILDVAKRQIVNCLLIFMVVMYAVAGGILFYYLENVESEKAKQELKNSVIECGLEILKNESASIDNQAKFIYDECVLPHHFIEPWSYIGGFVLAYSSMITIGYENLKLITDGGRMFYIFFCLVGMPLGVVFLANLGKFMEKAVGYIADRLNKYLKMKRKQNNQISPENEGSNDKKAENEEEFEIGGLLFLGLYFFYTAFGVLAMSFFDEYDVFDSLYLNFVAMTAMDATDFFSTRGILLTLSLVYITGGLALVTVAIGVLGKYLNYLQSIGKKLKGTRMKKIWFGGKSMYVNDLIHTVTDEVGIDRSQVDNLDLDVLIDKKLNPEEYESREIKDKEDMQGKGEEVGMAGNKEKTEVIQEEEEDDEFGTYKWARHGKKMSQQLEKGPLEKKPNVHEKLETQRITSSPKMKESAGEMKSKYKIQGQQQNVIVDNEKREIKEKNKLQATVPRKSAEGNSQVTENETDDESEHITFY